MGRKEKPWKEMEMKTEVTYVTNFILKSHQKKQEKKENIWKKRKNMDKKKKPWKEMKTEVTYLVDLILSQEKKEKVRKKIYGEKEKYEWKAETVERDGNENRSDVFT